MKCHSMSSKDKHFTNKSITYNTLSFSILSISELERNYIFNSF